jgi:hypothetical protein
VTVISDTTNAAVATFAVGSRPFGVAYDAAQGTVYVSNFLQGTLSIISQGASSVTFTEKGLVPGAEWYLNVSGQSPLSSTASTLVIDLSNGPYTYSIAAANKQYEPFPGAGVFRVAGVALAVPIAFSLVAYSVTFVETGLPSGTDWSVTLGGVLANSTTSSVAFMEPNGTYSFAVGSRAGYVSNPDTGSVPVDGLLFSESITFNLSPTSPKNGTGPPTSLGLPPAEWDALLGGIVAVVLVGALVAVFLRRRGQDPTPPPTVPPPPP